MPQFSWLNTVLGNLKTRFCGTFHTLNFDKYTRRFSMVDEMTNRVYIRFSSVYRTECGSPGSRGLMGNQEAAWKFWATLGSHGYRFQ